MRRIPDKITFAILGAVIIPCFGRLALHGTGFEFDLYRYLVPLFIGTAAGCLIGIMKDNWRTTKSHLVSTNNKLMAETNERQQAEKALRISEEKFRDLFENASDMIQAVTPDGKLRYVNRAWQETLGYDEEEAIGLSVFDVFDASSREYCRRLFHRVLAGEKIKNVEATFISKDGKKIIVEGNINCRFENGKPVNTWGIFRNITARKHVKEAFYQSEQRYRALFENNHCVMLLIDPETAAIVDANPAACAYYGYTVETITNMQITDINTLSRQEVFEEMERARAEKRNYFNFRHRLASGAVRDVEVFSGPIEIHGKSLLYSVIHDITDRKQAEKALQASENLLSDVFNSIQDGISILDTNLTIRHVNGVMKKWYAENLPMEGRKCHECYHNSPEPCHPCPTIRCIQSGKTEREIVPGLKESAVEWIELYSYPIKDRESQQVTGVVEFVRDITERRRAELALQESEEKFRTVTEQSPNMIFINKKGKVVYCNKKCQEIMGYSIEEFYSPEFDFLILIAPESIERIKKNLRRHMNGEKVQPYNCTLLTKEGKKIDAIITTQLIQYERETSILGIVTDITAIKRLEARLQQAEKMEAIGTLAGGIAHDFNNLLMGIQGRASLMMADTDPGRSDFEHLKEIESYVRSAVALTKQLLGFARGGKYEVKPTDLNILVSESAHMFGRTKKEISIHKKFDAKLRKAEVDRSQIGQVLLNIFINAWQAMPGGGDLYLQTENVTLDENHIEAFKIKSGKYVKISVTDTGVGMDEATRQRLFEPFFTTKEMGRGTGLGLASAYGIIKNHGGFIRVYSEIGKGTTFNIYLPAMETESLADVPEEKKPLSIFSGNETVLLVDDEVMIVDVGAKLLQKLGYTVITAGSGKEALELFQKNVDKIDLVILDMIMPEMGGGEAFDRLKEINPEIKVLLSSGYSINGKATEILDRGCSGFIQKPFNLEALSQKIREILDRK